MSSVEIVAEDQTDVKRRPQIATVAAASLGSVFEWYEFTLYAAMAGILASKFFSGLESSLSFFFALLTFGVGFVVRPLGALVFGRLGDLVGRKKTFLATLLITGLATFTVGALPTYASAGIVAPVLLVTLRVLQGLALGGEYGGAVIYVTEHVQRKRRGLSPSDFCWHSSQSRSFGLWRERTHLTHGHGAFRS
jgi:MFS family permease